MTIGKKILSGCGVLTAICLLVGGIAIRNVGKMGEAMESLGHHYVHSLYLTGDINYLTADIVSTNRGILIRGMIKDLEKARQYNDRFADDIERLKQEAGEFVQGTRRPELHDIGQNEILDKLNALASANSAMFDLLVKGDVSEATKVQTERVLPVARGISEAGEKLAQLEGKVVTAKADEAIATVAPAKIMSSLMICLSLIVAAIVVFIVRGVTRQLIVSVAALRDGADQVASAASQISSTSQSLAQGASEQAASLEETSASSEEINSMASKNTDNSRATAELLSQSQANVTSANQQLAEMVTSMNEITNSSGKISKIIKVIDEIAFQTNILALNAAVEAARAGEAGMGFAVVADEVRSLAQRSAQAAKDTTSLIEESIARSSEGQSKVDQVAAAIKAITEDTARIKVMVDEVSLGSEEQSRGIDQISRAIGQMEHVTQTSAASAEESAAAAAELNAQSQTMNDVVVRLYAMVDEGTAQTDLSRRRPVHGAATRVDENRPSPRRSVRNNRIAASLSMPMSASKTVNREQEATHPCATTPFEESFQSF